MGDRLTEGITDGSVDESRFKAGVGNIWKSSHCSMRLLRKQLCSTLPFIFLLQLKFYFVCCCSLFQVQSSSKSYDEKKQLQGRLQWCKPVLPLAKFGASQSVLEDFNFPDKLEKLLSIFIEIRQNDKQPRLRMTLSRHVDLVHKILYWKLLRKKLRQRTCIALFWKYARLNGAPKLAHQECTS